MKNLFAAAICVALLFTSCRKIQEDVYVIGGTGTVNESLVLEGKISSDRTLIAGNVYTIRGIAYVTNGAKLTIPAGTVLRGETSSKGALVITRGSQILANGTKDQPIVFTSDATAPKRGDWGGIVICGNAPTNASFNGQAGVGQVEGGVNNGEGLGLYGGTAANDNSGVLKYVRIEYAGYAYLPDNELNGLTLAGVGKGTTVDFVEIFKANDDAIECFGGTVDLRHTIFISTLDDDFDTDNGYNGTVQFGIILRDSSVADISRSESFESDNDANGSALTPQTGAVYSNITCIGPKATLSTVGNSLYLGGAQIRRNSSISIFNSVIMGWSTGLFIDASRGVPTDNNIRSGGLLVQNTIIAGCPTPTSYAVSTTPTGWAAADVSTWFATTANSNTIFTTNDEVKITSPFNYANPDFTPAAGSPLLSGAGFTNAKVAAAAGFTPVTFRGAVGPAGTPEGEWWKGWSKMNLSL